MDWVFEHLNVIIVIAGAVAYWLNQRRREKEGLPADYDEDGTPENRPTAAPGEFDTSTMDADEAERTRRLQEEMRLKREQRTGSSPALPADTLGVPPLPAPARREAAPPPVYRDPMAELMRELARKMTQPANQPEPAAQVPAAYAAEQEALERQRQLDEQYRALEERRTSLRKETAAFREESNAAQPATGTAGLSSGSFWLAELRNPSQVRRAIVLNEVLGKPLALRG